MSKADDETKTNEVFRIVAMWIALGAASVLILGYIYFIVKAFDPDIIRNQLKQQPRVTFGIPLAGFVAYCLVTLLKIGSGPIEFEVLGFKFRGSSGPIVLWVLCFLAITLAMKMLWVNV